MKSCIICGKEFDAKREDARFCSPNCRQKAVRNPDLLKSDKKQKKAEKPKECKVIEFTPPKKPYGGNILANVEITAADKERVSELYGKNDRRKSKCGF